MKKWSTTFATFFQKNQINPATGDEVNISAIRLNEKILY